ncbi:UDP-glucuronosyltransferase 2B15-like isoform X3 [Drosophila guanche]|uniref:Blast:UDP-glucuronosyltransferase 2B1 n=1 Tax=Drosophila guanche TaxID=7266 RepID=A0A3B0KIA2_DROGU|nr:UDP-glucuronosyltransferase 2B15-like isoform X1 [Drosophila guanche]XP_034135025.1 UDP-glucuronosyltransferase 2B15-like isoform X2 [Drosophila guanche]XP_034135026.1 UDP-glucuronosyltransferase 2B15-like isoform X3 [Drosophila guanche]SPP86139.1 blast:UDP-glucuronosyltransferase 2B1 [Drosophila guanche]
MVRILLLVVVGALIGSSLGANILGLFTSLSPSHLIIQMSAVQALAERGHNVTVVTVLQPAVSHKDINVISVPLSAEESQYLSELFAAMSRNDDKNMLFAMFRMFGQMGFMSQKMADAFKDPRVRDLYHNKENRFDLVLSGFALNDYQMGFAQKVKAPVIVLATMPPGPLLNYLIGNPEELSYVPDMSDSVEKGKGMSFKQRLSGYLMGLGYKLFSRMIERRNQKYYKELFGDDPNMPEYSEMMKNASLVFFASHALSEGPVRPNVPGVIEIGGIQIKDTPAPLPQNMEEFLANATNGGILLSLGSNVQGKHLSPDTVQKMFNVLSKLKERVIWKWEDLENTPGKSDNILYSKWLPQDDILAHPKIKLFINHAGKGGLTEAQYHGKPMLSLPVFGDQPANADGMVKKGFGLTINLLTLEEQPFREGIEEILSNPKYSQTVSTFSKLYRDRPLTARETVIYWTEYVIRHHGAPHLQSPVMHMSFIAANNLDIYAILAIIVVVLLLLAKAVIKFIIRKLSSKSKKVKKQ